MDNFKNFQLTTEEASMVTGARKGKRGNFVKSLSDEERAALKASLTELKSSEGWADLSKEARKEAKAEVFAQFKPTDA